MTSLTPVLPRELLDLIIDQTRTSLQDRPNLTKDQDDLEYKTLCIFLLVSRSFRRRALAYIFDHLQFFITVDHPTDRLASFRGILESSPFPSSTPENLGWHVDEASLSFKPVLDSNSRNASFDSKVICQESVINLLRSLYRHTPNLSTLTMRIDGDCTVEWTSLDAAYREAFHALVRLDSLRSLRTTNVVRYPVTFLKGTQLLSLAIWQEKGYSIDVSENPSMVFSPANPEDIDLPDPALEVLVTDHTYPIGAFPDVSPSRSIFSGLKTLRSIARNLRDVRQTWTILSAVPVLENLSLELHGKYYSSYYLVFIPLISRKDRIETPPGFNVGHLPDLEFLEFYHVRLRDLPYNSTNDENLAIILDFLEPATPLEHFEELHLKLFFAERNVETNFFHPTPRTGISKWEQLDTLLMGPKYPALETVMISLVVHVWVSQHFEDFDHEAFLVSTTQKLQGQFPRLASTDRISFELNLESGETRSRT